MANITAILVLKQTTVVIILCLMNNVDKTFESC